MEIYLLMKNNQIINCPQDSKEVKEQYSKFLKNKRVVIVGPSSHIVNSNQGNLIDSYDVVVRISHGYIIPKNFEKHIGTRTDIIYNPMLPQKGSGITMPVDNLKNKVKWVCASYPAKKHFQDILDFKAKVKNKILFHVVNENFWQKLTYHMKVPHGGTVAILDILRYDISELFVTGITFYQNSKNNIHYYDGYHKENKTFKKRKNGKTSKHDPRKQLKYVKKRYDQSNIFFCDDTLKNIFKKG